MHETVWYQPKYKYIIVAWHDGLCLFMQRQENAHIATTAVSLDGVKDFMRFSMKCEYLGEL
jgi:hypothetical protein